MRATPLYRHVVREEVMLFVSLRSFIASVFADASLKHVRDNEKTTSHHIGLFVYALQVWRLSLA